MMLAILYTDGEIALKEVRECQSGRWAPLLAYRPKGQSDATPTIPLFDLDDIARQFVRRNIPKNWVVGAVQLTEADLEWMRGKGWQIEVFNFPRKLSDFDITVEILEFSTEPEIFFSHR